MRQILIVLLILAFSACSYAAEPPNIVLIIADDQSWMDYGFMGNERVHTPNLDALAEQSARFVHGYVPSSVCRPSLVTMLTGLYPHQHGVHFNHGPPGNAGYNRMESREEYERARRREFKLIRRVETLPGILKQELDYRSLQTGKFWEGHWRNGGFTAGMTRFEPPPVDQMFGGGRTLRSGERVAHGNGDWGLQIGRRTMTPIHEFIDASEAAGQPWLVWYAPYLPHQPHDSPQRFYDMAGSRPNVEENELPYFASIAQFDETVGELVDFVEKQGLADNALFLFVSDNGWRPSQTRQRQRLEEFAHTKRSKRAPFDDGLRTPILIRWDRVVQPATHEGLVSTVDIVPTLLAATGIDPGALTSLNKTNFTLPGLNLLPVARGETSIPGDRAIFGDVYPGDASRLGHPEGDIAYRWVRQKNLKLIVPHVHSPQTKPWGNYLDNVALFDVNTDPFETNNLARSESQKEEVIRLRRLLDDWWDPNAP